MTVDPYTAQVTRDTLTSITGQYFDLDKPFAFPRYGNICTSFTTGRDYFKAVAGAIRTAKSFVMITDWQLDYDMELDRRGEQGHPGRLSELLAQAIQRGVHIRIILYDSIKKAVDCHEEVARRKLSRLPKGPGSISVMLQNPNTGRNTISLESGLLFSHHQKSIVVDGRVAFLGGMDLAYGRWDTNALNVVVDPRQHVLNDAYNQQIVPARSITISERQLLNEKDGKPGFEAPYSASQKVLDEQFQPRQPWQDVGVLIEGPGAYDVFVNFVLRWNSFAAKDTNAFDRPMAVDWFTQARGADHLVDPLKIGHGAAVVQICRSTSSTQLHDELVLWDDQHRYVNDDWKSVDLKRRKIVQAARAAWANEHQTSIRDAMINCIRSAQAFIYIENQFFMSDCGVDEYGTRAPSRNQIIRELANVVGKAIFAGRPFHIWLTLPEHPEGLLEEDGTSAQAWWALQGVKRGRDSLIHRINQFLVEKNAQAWSLDVVPILPEQVLNLLQSKGLENEWRRYLTILNPRNYGRTENYLLTEMIYVHSKVLIVDDAVAVIGSANINDRSLEGNGDTELAAVVVDTAEVTVTDVGSGVNVITRKFARELRISLWEKGLGIRVDEIGSGVQKGSVPVNIDIKRPLSFASINGIQKMARVNREAYNAVFLHTPRDGFKNLTEGRKLAYPVLSVEKNTRDFSQPPRLQQAYMREAKHNVEAAIAYLRAHVRGFWLEMPLNWAYAQGSTPRSPTHLPALIAEAGKQESESEAV